MNANNSLGYKFFWGAILAIALFWRLWGIGSQDILGDEVAYSFRAIGYLDYLGTSFQTQPVDWYKDTFIPFWTKLSFHDHPPLVFLIQHIFFYLFGYSLVIAKLPSIIFGVIAIILFYLILKKAFTGALPIIATIIFALQPAAVWISRSSLMEAILLPLLLLNIYLFFLFLENKKWWWVWGMTLGLVVFTKYTGIFLLPVYFLYLLFFYREKFKDWRFWAALVSAIIVFSPVIIYNINLYLTRGHFDLQISYILGQETPEWTGLAGKAQDPFSSIVRNILLLYGAHGAALFIIGAGLFWWRVWRKGVYKINDSELKIFIFFSLYALFLTLLFVVIGVAPRFLVLYIPVFILFTAYVLAELWRYDDRLHLFKIFVVGFLALMIWFSYQINFVKFPDYGVASLDQYFNEEFRGKESGILPESDNFNLNEVIKQFARKKSKDAPRHYSMIIYNDNVAHGTLAWIFYRRFFYENIPTMYVENYRKILASLGESYFKGFDLYFVQSTSNTMLNPFKTEKEAGDQLENELREMVLLPSRTIYGKGGKEMFRVYKFRL